MDQCAKCGHIRYPGDQFDGRCDECEAWAQLKIASLEAFAEAVREAGYAAITDEQYSATIRSALDRLDAAKKEGEI